MTMLFFSFCIWLLQTAWLLRVGSSHRRGRLRPRRQLRPRRACSRQPEPPPRPCPMEAARRRHARALARPAARDRSCLLPPLPRPQQITRQPGRAVWPHGRRKDGALAPAPLRPHDAHLLVAREDCRPVRSRRRRRQRGDAGRCAWLRAAALAAAERGGERGSSGLRHRRLAPRAAVQGGGRGPLRRAVARGGAAALARAARGAEQERGAWCGEPRVGPHASRGRGPKGADVPHPCATLTEPSPARCCPAPLPAPSPLAAPPPQRRRPLDLASSRRCDSRAPPWPTRAAPAPRTSLASVPPASRLRRRGSPPSSSRRPPRRPSSTPCAALCSSTSGERAGPADA